jgi:murein peptide amidase A
MSQQRERATFANVSAVLLSAAAVGAVAYAVLSSTASMSAPREIREAAVVTRAPAVVSTARETKRLAGGSAEVATPPVPARAAVSGGVKRVVIGRSVQGRPIVAWALGRARAPRKVLVVGCIHGNECAGLAITSALMRPRVPTGVQLWIVPEMNPDGTAADTRQNAHGVDLNRNFPYRWQPISDPTYYSGPHASSEPETRAAMRLVRRIRPAVTIWYHQHMDLVAMAGGDRGVARRYAQLAGLRPTCLTFLSGVETGWSNHTLPGTTSFVVELPAGPVLPAALTRHLRAVRATELGQRSGSTSRCDSITTAS